MRKAKSYFSVEPAFLILQASRDSRNIRFGSRAAVAGRRMAQPLS
jgi:hypothetical protein